MNFDEAATTIPGNIAGSIGAGGPPGHTRLDPDTRNASGNVTIIATPGAGGAAGTVVVIPQLTFHVHDTVDFCPGGLGSVAAQAVTIFMSRLEGTGARFGPVFAADVPFDIDYPGFGIPRTGPFTPPPPPPPSPPPPPVRLPTRVLFDFDSAVVREDGKRTLRRLLPRLRASPSTDVVGHTDARGSRAYNEGLSERRAEAVVEELIRQDPTLAGRLHSSGQGEEEPEVPDATTDQEHERNRRVELIFGP